MQKIFSPRKGSGVVVVFVGGHAVFPERRLVFEFEPVRGAIIFWAASAVQLFVAHLLSATSIYVWVPGAVW
jgi:hypothetical protein